MGARATIEYFGFRLALALLSALPLEFAADLTAALWRAVAPRLKRHARAREHLARAFPEKSAAERERIAREMWGHLGRTFAEFPHLQTILDQGRIDVENPEVLAQARAAPFVACSMHIGNWELIAGVSARVARPLAGVYQPLTNPRVDAALWDLRAPLYPLGLLPRSPATLRRLMRIAREGGSLCFLADLREGKGAAVPFFGRLAYSNTAPALIARQCGLPLYAARLLRRPGARFSIRIEPVEVPVTANGQADVAAATANLQARFEAFVREAPEQWMWAHRRWD